MDASIPRMNRRARRRFVAIGRRSRDRRAHLRFLVIAHLAAGRSMAEAARFAMVAPATVSRVARRFQEGGQLALFDARAGNGPRKVDPAFLKTSHGCSAVRPRTTVSPAPPGPGSCCAR